MDEKFKTKSFSSQPESKSTNPPYPTGHTEPVDSKVGRLEAKTESLELRIDSHLTMSKWLFIAAITSIAVAVAIGTFTFQVVKGSFECYTELQSKYYKEVADLRCLLKNDMQSSKKIRSK
jgi:hypothetical protein